MADPKDTKQPEAQAVDNKLAEKPAGLVRVRSKLHNDFYNPYTKQTISRSEESEVVLDSWFESQIEAGYIELLG